METLFGLFACAWVGNSTVNLTWRVVPELLGCAAKPELPDRPCSTGARGGAFLGTAFLWGWKFHLPFAAVARPMDEFPVVRWEPPPRPPVRPPRPPPLSDTGYPPSYLSGICPVPTVDKLPMMLVLGGGAIYLVTEILRIPWYLLYLQGFLLSAVNIDTEIIA